MIKMYGSFQFILPGPSNVYGTTEQRNCSNFNTSVIAPRGLLNLAQRVYHDCKICIINFISGPGHSLHSLKCGKRLAGTHQNFVNCLDV